MPNANRQSTSEPQKTKFNEKTRCCLFLSFSLASTCDFSIVGTVNGSGEHVVAFMCKKNKAAEEEKYVEQLQENNKYGHFYRLWLAQLSTATHSTAAANATNIFHFLSWFCALRFFFHSLSFSLYTCLYRSARVANAKRENNWRRKHESKCSDEPGENENLLN